jgi:hypothetical protein
LRTPDTRTRDPVGWSRTDLRPEVPAQRSRAHGGAPGDDGEREISTEILFNPHQDLADGRVVAGGRFVNNKLRLSAGPFERHNRGSRDASCHLSAKVTSHNVETQIEACRGTCGRQDISVVDIEDVGIDVNSRVAARQFRRREPMCGRSQPIQRSGRSENERTTANGSDSFAPTNRSANRAQQLVGN